jgi:hypothetical protein
MSRRARVFWMGALLAVVLAGAVAFFVMLYLLLQKD